MTKLMLIPNKNMLDIECDAFLIGIEGLSVNMPCYFKIEELKSIKKDKEIFVSLNKNMHTKDLEYLKKTLFELNKMNIKAIVYYDIAVLNIAKKYNLNIDLVWAQEHMTTNYETINYWYEKGTKYTLLSQELTKNEIIKIKQNTKSKLILPIIGYIPMFVSKRHLVKNYLKEFKLNDNSQINYIEKEGKLYPIIDEHVTTVYSSSYQNSLMEYLTFKNNKIDYVLINSLLIEKENIKKIIEIIKTTNEENIKENYLLINKLLNNNTDTYFLHKESIYKVK